MDLVSDHDGIVTTIDSLINGNNIVIVLEENRKLLKTLSVIFYLELNFQMERRVAIDGKLQW